MLRNTKFQYAEWQGQYEITYESCHKSKVIKTFNGGDDCYYITELSYSSAVICKSAATCNSVIFTFSRPQHICIAETSHKHHGSEGVKGRGA